MDFTEEESQSKAEQTFANTNEESEPATIEHLIVLLVSSDKLVLDKSFVFSFFLSSRVFISAHQLLLLIFEKTIHFILYHEELSEDIIKQSLARFIAILKEWTRYFPYDFRETKMTNLFETIREKCLLINDTFTNEFKQMSTFLERENKNLRYYEEYLKIIHYEIRSKNNKSLLETGIMEICPNPNELAVQLTHIELDRLSHIGPEEFVHHFIKQEKENEMKKPPKLPQNSMKFGSKFGSKNFAVYLEELKKACESEVYIKKTNNMEYNIKTSSNIEAYTLWFNRLTSFVSTEIVKHPRKEKRVQVINYFIEVAHHCFEIRNYNSTMAIYAALSSNPVSRLKKTWQKIDKEKWELLVKNADPSNNYLIYRKILKNSKDDHQLQKKIMIPVFALVMRDLSYLYNSIPNNDYKGYLNLAKFWQMAKYISDNILGKNAPFNFPQRNEIINHLLTEPILTEEACAYTSFKCERPKTDGEMNYYQNIKNRFMNI